MLYDLTLSIDMNDPVVGKANMDQHSFMSAGHIGTHLDTYLQSPIPPEFCVRQGKVYDATRFAGRDVDLSVLEGQPAEAGDFAIFHTGFLEKHRYGTREYFKDHPQLSWELIDHLIGAGVSFLGIDAAGVRRGDEHGVADRRAEEGGVYIIENLNNIGELARAAQDGDFRIFTGWTGLRGFSGLSCRVIADFGRYV
ncbi:cyclase family protein [Caballeronia sp. LZ035]|uniref:cyclase family protein n=1 Tax=Caballeronia sp. LZ035 TaxID=3038568 RepID=UPI002855396F|nr:cyclase family protein [Caballeronia sp. LZ035]MDR5761408.1 cyclase family protein [Caballeronia sp. LZ035]